MVRRISIMRIHAFAISEIDFIKHSVEDSKYNITCLNFIR